MKEKPIVLHLITSKCLAVLLYGLEICPPSKSDLQSVAFLVNRAVLYYYMHGEEYFQTAFLVLCNNKIITQI